MKTLRVAAIALVAILVAAPSAARAGGWWSTPDLRNSYLVVGKEVQAGTQFLFATIEEAERARASGEFFVYLVQNLDWRMVDRAMSRPGPRPGWWHLGDATAIRLGRVHLSGPDSNMARARAHFVVPDVATGPYALMFCTAGCSRPLGHIVPGRVRVVPDVLSAKVALATDSLQRRLTEAVHAVHRLRDASYRDRGLANVAIARLENRVERLQRALQDARNVESAPPAGPTTAPDGTAAKAAPWWAFIGWYVAGLAAIALAASLARSHRTARRSPEMDELDRELRELTSTRR